MGGAARDLERGKGLIQWGRKRSLGRSGVLTDVSDSGGRCAIGGDLVIFRGFDNVADGAQNHFMRGRREELFATI